MSGHNDRESFMEYTRTDVDFLELECRFACSKLPTTRTSAFKFDFKQAECVMKYNHLRNELELTTSETQRQFLLMELEQSKRLVDQLVDTVTNSIAHSLVYGLGQMLEKEMFG